MNGILVNGYFTKASAGKGRIVLKSFTDIYCIYFTTVSLPFLADAKAKDVSQPLVAQNNGVCTLKCLKGLA